MKRALFITSLFCLILCSGCSVLNGQSKRNQQYPFVPDKLFQDYIPISPLEFDQPVRVFDPASKTFKEMLLAELATDLPKVRAFIPNQDSYTAVQKMDASGEFKFGPANLTAEAGLYKVYFDYCKFATLKVAKGDGTCPGFAKVGVGFRIVARVTTFEAGVDVSSLLSIGVSAKLSKLAGELSIEVIGIDSPKVTDLMTMPVDISQASIQNALQSMAAIKSKIWDTDVSLSPNVMAIKKMSGGCSLADIFNNTNTSKALKAVY